MVLLRRAPRDRGHVGGFRNDGFPVRGLAEYHIPQLAADPFDDFGAYDPGLKGRLCHWLPAFFRDVPGRSRVARGLLNVAQGSCIHPVLDPVDLVVWIVHEKERRLFPVLFTVLSIEACTLPLSGCGSKGEFRAAPPTERKTI